MFKKFFNIITDTIVWINECSADMLYVSFLGTTVFAFLSVSTKIITSILKKFK